MGVRNGEEKIFEIHTKGWFSKKWKESAECTFTLNKLSKFEGPPSCTPESRCSICSQHVLPCAPDLPGENLIGHVYLMDISKEGFGKGCNRFIRSSSNSVKRGEKISDFFRYLCLDSGALISAKVESDVKADIVREGDYIGFHEAFELPASLDSMWDSTPPLSLYGGSPGFIRFALIGPDPNEGKLKKSTSRRMSRTTL